MHPLIGRWFAGRFGEPTAAQALAWPAIRSGADTLVVAPTGSGKTLAAMLASIDELWRAWEASEPGGLRIHTLYVSPLRALSHDVHRSLEQPLAELEGLAREDGRSWPGIEVGVRTADTPPARRRAMARRPPHILVTTPESLFLLLVSPSMRVALASVRRVVVDELHSLAPTKRGAHLALSLELLEELAGHPVQRVGLSATQRPPEVMAAFLAGRRAPQVRLIALDGRREMDLAVLSPLDDAEDRTVWPAVVRRLQELVESRRSTLIFVNNRRQAERLTHELNAAAGGRVAATHHGSLGRPARLEVERALKAGELRAVVATSSLELGIDVGAVDLVVQVGSPREVARGVQRFGRSGHRPGERATGRIIPTHPAELLESAALSWAMREFDLEPVRLPAAPADVLAQHVVAAALLREWHEEEFLEVVRRAASYADISREKLRRVLRLVAGGGAPGRGLRVRPLVEWDPGTGRFRAAPAARAALVAGAGTIPDRGTYPVVLRGSSVQLGELDEEFVFESRPGDVFWLGNSAWRMELLRPDRVEVSRAGPGPARIPFWHGEMPGRSAHLAGRVGQLLEAAERALTGPPAQAAAFGRWLQEGCGLEPAAARSLQDYLTRQLQACGSLPGRRRAVVELFADEAGDVRVAVHSPWGMPVHRAWGLAMVAWARQAWGLEPDFLAADDGILLRFPAGAPLDVRSLVTLAGEDPADLVRRQLPGSQLVARLFREAAGRALLLPRPRGRRVPLWQQRLKAADLMLEAARQGPDGPLAVLLEEAVQEALEQVLDLPTLASLVEKLREGQVDLHVVFNRLPSPFASSLLFAFTAEYLYQPDAPKTERRAALLMGDPDEALREAARSAGLWTVIDPEVAREAAEELALPPSLRNRPLLGPDDVDEWLRAAGDLTEAEMRRRVPDALEDRIPAWLAELERQGRALRWQPAPASRQVGAAQALWVHAELAGLYRSALSGQAVRGWDEAAGASLEADPGDEAEALAALLERRARWMGPFGPAELARRYGLRPETVEAALGLLEARGVLLRGQLDPREEPVWLDLEVARILRRRTRVRARQLAEPVPAEVFARFLLSWHGVLRQEREAGEAGGAPPLETAEAAPGAAGAAGQLRRLTGAFLEPLDLLGPVVAARLGRHYRRRLEAALRSGEIAWTRRPAPDGRLPVTLLARDLAPEVAALIEEARAPVAVGLRLAAEGTAGTDPARPNGPAPGERPDAPRGGPWPPAGEVADELERVLAAGGAWFAGELARRLGRDEAVVRQCLAQLVAAGRVASEDPVGLWEATLRSRPGASLAARLTEGHTPSWLAGLPALRPRGPRAYRRLPRRVRRALRERVVSRVAEAAGVGARARIGAAGAGPSGLASAPEGRFWLLRAAGDPPHPSEAWARLLLERYGVVSREVARADGCPLPWAHVAAALERMQATGLALQGFFVEGLSPDQFALPAALEELRRHHRPDRSAMPGASPSAGEVHVLSAHDPAMALGRILPPPPWWPARTGGALVAAVDGHPVLLVRPSSGGLWWDPAWFGETGPQGRQRVLDALVNFLATLWPGRRLVLRRIQDAPVADRPEEAGWLAEAGFLRGPRTLERWLVDA